MIEHGNAKEESPKRTVILGSAGFVGRAVLERFKAAGTETVGVTREDVDFSSPQAAAFLAERIRPEDVVIIAAAAAPCKDGAMLLSNIAMMHSICQAVEKKQPAQVVYISSDAVYSDSPAPMTEASPAEPGSMHGVMHLAREIMIKQVTRGRLAIIRPTLIYGSQDPHNGYGPNRFMRQCLKGEDIQLFGEGEERRDHVSIDDVSNLVYRAVLRRSAGVLNAATGVVTSFKEIAQLAVKLSGKDVRVLGSPRQGPMPHNGYRAFDISAVEQSFPGFRFISLEDGMKKALAGIKSGEQ